VARLWNRITTCTFTLSWSNAKAGKQTPCESNDVSRAWRCTCLRIAHSLCEVGVYIDLSPLSTTIGYPSDYGLTGTRHIFALLTGCVGRLEHDAGCRLLDFPPQAIRTTPYTVLRLHRRLTYAPIVCRIGAADRSSREKTGLRSHWVDEMILGC
jgi:hypothetical protein